MNKILSFANRHWGTILVISLALVALAVARIGFQESKQLEAKEARIKALEERRQKDELETRQSIFKRCSELDGVPILGYGFSIVCLRKNSGCLHFAEQPPPDSFDSAPPSN